MECKLVVFEICQGRECPDQQRGKRIHLIWWMSLTPSGVFVPDFEPHP